MKRHILSFLLITIFFLGLAINAQALPMLPADSPVYFQFNNLEQVDQSGNNAITMPGTNPLTGNTYYDDFGTMGNWGVFNLSSIQTGSVSNPHADISGGSVVWADMEVLNQGQIHGVFFDIDLTSGTTATGGYMDLYWTDNYDITESDLDGTSTLDDSVVTKFTAGTFLARIGFSSGVIDGDSVTTISSTVDITSVGAGQTGRSDSYGDVDTSLGGAWADVMDSDWFWTDEDADGTRGETGEQHDIRFSTFFSGLDPASDWNDTTNGIQGLRSNDPARLYTTPEPASIMLLGIGILGFAGILRRKSK